MNKIQMRITILLLLLLGAFILVSIGALKYESTPDNYYNEDKSVHLQVDEGTYYVNGVRLELEEVGVLNSAKGFLSGFIPGVPFIICGFLLVLIAMKVSKGMPIWYIVSQLKGKPKPQGKIQLSRAPGGVIATRSWDINKDGYLKSVAQRTVWHNLILEADTMPCIGNWKGIYAHRLGTTVDEHGSIAGIVSLSGKVVGHKDSILRAQKCTILELIVKKEKQAEQLRLNYACPIVVASNIGQAIQNWALSSEGIFWMLHNDKLLTKKLNDKLAQAIETLPAYQQF